MNCRQFDSRLDTDLDGEIGARRRAQMDGHAAGCPACRAQLEALRQAEHALRVPEFHAAPPGMLTEFHRRLDRAHRRGPLSRAPALAWPWAAGTALAAAAALAAFVSLPHSPRVPEPPSGEFSRIASGKPSTGQPSSTPGRPFTTHRKQPAPATGD